MLLTPNEAMIICAGRCPWYWKYLNVILNDADWNDTVNTYNNLEDQLDNGIKTGIDTAPIRPRPGNRP